MVPSINKKVVLIFGIAVYLLTIWGCPQSEKKSTDNNIALNKVISSTCDTIYSEAGQSAMKGMNDKEISPWIRLSIRDTGFYNPCQKCMELNIPYYSVSSSYGNRPAHIFFNRYDFLHKHFSWGIFPTGDRVIVIEDEEIWPEDHFHNSISKGRHQIEWTDTSLFFSFLGKRRNFGIHDETVPMRQYLAVHYILREGNNLTHAIYEDTIPPFQSIDKTKVLKEGAMMKISTDGKEKGLKFHYKGDSATWDDIEIVIEE